VLNAHKNQARLLVAGDDLNRVGDHFFGAFKKLCRVQRLAQRMRANDADAGRIEALQTFGKQRQAGKPALHRLFAQHVIAVQPVSQMHALLKATNDLHRAIHHTGNHHVETV